MASPLFFYSLLLLSLLACTPPGPKPSSGNGPASDAGPETPGGQAPKTVLSQRAGNFNRQVSAEALGPSGLGRTRMAIIGNRAYFLEGFGQGEGVGRLMSVQLEDEDPIAEEVVSSEQSSHSSTLTNPWGLASDGQALYLTTGFQNSSEGAILRVSQLKEEEGRVLGQFERLATEVEDIINPSFLLVVEIDGGRYCYWSEYTASGNSGGRVRRTRIDGDGQAETFLEQLAFPAGLATDGTELLVCESDGGRSGRVLKMPLAFTGTALRPDSPTVLEISAGTEPAIRRPFDVAYDGNEGYFFSEGQSIIGCGLAPDTVGRIRFVSRSDRTAHMVTKALPPCSGLEAVNIEKGLSGVIFASELGLHRLLSSTKEPIESEAPLLVELPHASDVLIEDPSEPLFGCISSPGDGEGEVVMFRPLAR